MSIMSQMLCYDLHKWTVPGVTNTPETILGLLFVFPFVTIPSKKKAKRILLRVY